MIVQQLQFVRMSSGKSSIPSWELTASGFDRLLASLDSDRDKAAEIYLRLKKNLVRFFEARGFITADDAADESLDRLTRKLDTGETIDNPQTYVLGIARLVALELYKRPKTVAADVAGVEAIATDDEDLTTRAEEEGRLKCLDDCLADLSDEKRQIIVIYYSGEKRTKIENRANLASKLGIPAGALRSRATRIRDILEDCIVECTRKM